MPSRDLSSKAWAALVAVYIIWGSTYLAIAYVVDTMPPLLSAGVRWLVAGVVLYALGSRRSTPSERPTRAQWTSAAIIGAALLLGGNGFVSIGESVGLASGTAGLLVATVPLWLAFLDRVVFRARISRWAVLGLLLGFAGAGLLGTEKNAPIAGVLWVLSASAIWACGSLYARTADLPSRPVLSTGMEMLCGSVALLVAGAARGEFGHIDAEAFTRDSLLGLAYLIVFGSIVAFSAYVWLLRNARTTMVGTYAFVNPLVAVLLGSLFRDEKVTLVTGIAGALIVVSVAIIVLSGRAKAPRTEDSAGLSGASDIP